MGLEKSSAPSLSKVSKRLSQGLIFLDYACVLPCMARLPRAWGRSLARLRGRLYASWGRDWRNFSFGDTVHVRTKQVIEQLRTGSSQAAKALLYQERFEHQSIEEYEAACLHTGVTQDWPVQFAGMDGVKKVIEEKGRVVFVTSHFSSSILGTAFLGALGVPVLGMSSNVVDRAEVHPSVSRTYRRKYKAMGWYLNGGAILDREGNTHKFVRFLKKGGAVVIVGDLPPEPNEAPRWARFLGEIRGFAAGAQRLSDMLDAPLMSFVCQFEKGQHWVKFSAPGEDPYEFLSGKIERDLGQWWAMDVLGAYPLQPMRPDQNALQNVVSQGASTLTE
jgi:lauroyl/myristoyl acyltransferase